MSLYSHNKKAQNPKKGVEEMTITPAYGRDYKNLKDLKKDFEENKDFILNTPFGSTYINREGLIDLGKKEVQARYSKLTKVTILKV